MKFIIQEKNLSNLADQLCDQIKKNWKNPFEAPVIIFSDRKVEQWFKQYILKKAEKKDSIILNLKAQMIEQFMFELIENSEDSVEKLSVELLRDCIVSKLVSKVSDNQFYYETLNSKDVNDYICSDDKINEARLFDFASQMAVLFKEYEFSRPDYISTVDGKIVEKGIISSWLNGEDFFFNDSDNNICGDFESWQRKLYNDTIGKGIFFEGKSYKMLPELYFQKKQKGNVKFSYNSSAPIFLFGYTGIGQFFRNVLNDFAIEKDVYIFTHVFEEKSTNPLIKAFYKNGNQFISLWKDNNFTVSEPGEIKINSNSLLAKVQKSVIENQKQLFDAKEDDSLTFTSAVSKIREIEYVHSKVFNLIKNENAVLSDFLIVAPDITEYKTAILTVFGHNNKDDRNFPYIPFRFIDNDNQESLIAAAVNIIYEIARKKSLSRLDFFELVRNPVVQRVKNITEDNISAWVNWVSSMNIYRDRKSSENDWINGVRRLLLARLTEKPAVICNEDFLPYEDIESVDNDQLCKFSDCVEELEEWIDFASKVEYLKKEDLFYIKSFMNKWFFLDEKKSEDYISEKIIYDGVLDEIHNQSYFIKEKDCNISFKLFAQAIKQSVGSKPYSTGKIFIDGLSFASFEPNRILPVKYLFFIGLNSKKFPFCEKYNMLDLREWSNIKIKSDSKIQDRQKYAFLCQLMNVEKGLFFSYVNKNLASDEQFFQSSVIYELRKFIGKNASIEQNITVDEKRKWSELWTNREFRNKRNYISMTEKNFVEENNQACESEKNILYPDRVDLYQIRKFLEDPFIFQIGKIFVEAEDDYEEEKQELEPVFVDALTNYALMKCIIKNAISKNSFELTEVAPFLDEQYNLQIFKNIHKLPDDFFGEQYVECLLKNVNSRLNSIKGVEIFNSENFVFEYNLDIPITQEINGQKNLWTLSGNAEWFNKDYEETNVLTILTMGGKSAKEIKFLQSYVTALGLIASSKENKSYSVNLFCCFESGIESRAVDISKDEAMGVLKKIYNLAYVQKYMKTVPYDFLSLTFESLSEFEKKLNPNKNQFSSPWRYFAKSNLFDIEKDVGFTAEEFQQQWQESVDLLKSLILFIKE